MPTRETQSPGSAETAPFERSALERFVEHEIRTPLAALRARLESLARGLAGDESVKPAVSRVLAELARIQDNVDTVCELAVPHTPDPLRCSLEEIARSSLQQLPCESRRRVRLAKDSAPRALVVDGHHLSHALAHLLRGALREGPDEILLHTLEDEEFAYFVISCEVAPRTTSARQTADIRLSLAKREIERMGGLIDDQRSSQRIRSVSVRFPLQVLERSSR